MKSRRFIVLLLILLFVATELLVLRVTERRKASVPTNPSLPSVDSGKKAYSSAEINSPVSNGVSAITSSIPSGANVSQSSASQTNSPATNAASQSIADVPRDVVQPPVTPVAPPPSEMGRTDAPVIPPGQGRVFSGP